MLHHKQLIARIFRLRASQVVHLYHDTGFAYTLIVILLAAAASVWGCKVAGGTGLAAYVPAGIFAASVYSIQANRRDRSFLSIHFGSYLLLYMAEYLAFGILFIILYAFAGNWLGAAAVVGAAVAVSFVPQVEIKRSAFGRLWDRLPAQAYEVKSFMRRGGMIFAALWLLMCALPIYTAVIPVGLAIGGMLAVSCYEWGEPVEVLRSAQLGTRAFLVQRFMLIMKLLGAWSLVPSVLFIAFNPEYWYVIPAVMAVVATVLGYTIALKYAFYVPNEKLNARLFAAIGPAGIFIPIFFPLVLVLAVYFYGRAQARLKPFLHDFDTIA